MDWFNKIILAVAFTVEQNASVLFAAFIGSLVSVVAREEHSFISALASFLCGIFAGWYLSRIAAAYLPIPIEPLAAVLALMGRDLVTHIIRIGKKNPFIILGKLKDLGNVTDERNKTDKEN